ncbi:MAG: monovalent cation/H(+) antiporter subunit G [Acidimicrobiales bacterium]
MDVISAALMAVGAAFVLLAGVGLHRFDDVFARMHAAGKASTLGLLLILFGATFRLTESGEVLKLGLVAVLAVITIPAGVHLIARAAWRAGTELAEATTFDDASQRRLDEF